MGTLHVAFGPCCYGGEDFLPPVMSNFVRMEVAHEDPATGVSGLLLALTDNHKPAVQRNKESGSDCCLWHMSSVILAKPSLPQLQKQEQLSLTP